jgi:transposase-like protein
MTATTYTPELGAKFCAAMASTTDSIATICRRAGMPSKATVFRWKSEHPLFAAMYDAAKSAQIDTQFDEIVEIADNCKADKDSVAKAKLRIYARIEAAQRLKPKEYGLKVAHGGTDDLPPMKTESHVTVTAEEAYKRMLDGGT